MNLTKKVTEKVVAANRKNAEKSTGPKNAANVRHNAVTHGLFARELVVSPEDKPDFESLRDNLLRQLAPQTPLQDVAVEKVISSCWRCKLATRLEMHHLKAHLTTADQDLPDDSEEPRDERVLQWFGASYQDLMRGKRLLEDLCSDFAENGGMHLDNRKDAIVKAFGVGFYDTLNEWRPPMSMDTILMAESIAAHEKRYGPSSTAPSQTPDEPKVVRDPRQNCQMLVKLVEMQIQHLADIRTVTAQGPRTRGQADTDFEPRYFTTASRDLHRAVDWYLYLKSKDL